MYNLWKSLKAVLLPLWVTTTYLFLYIPLIILMVFSFNNTTFPYRWVNFSWRWYQELFASSEIMAAAKTSFIVGISAVVLSLTLGLLFVVWTTKKRVDHLMVIFYPNLIVPEIVLAVGLLSFFIFFSVPLGVTTLIVGHTLLGLGYAVPIIYGSFQSIDQSIIEASLSLGATHRQTFFKVVLPMLAPALIAAGLLVFIISFDDFLIAFFCAGSSVQTLSLYIFSMIRSGVSPVVNALATFMLVASSLLVMIFCFFKTKEEVW